MKKLKYCLIVFFLGAIYMILELVCSRILAPYFGTSNLVWTSIIGIILLSSSIGNYLGGIIADKNSSNSSIQFILLISAISIMAIGLFQRFILSIISLLIVDIKIGAIFSTIILFFIPSMFIGLLSPILIKLCINSLESAGRTSGLIYALSTLGSIVGTFLGGFWLIPSMGSIEILYLLAICLFLMIIMLDFKYKLFLIISIILIFLNSLFLVNFYKTNTNNKQLILDNGFNVYADFDTMYGRVNIINIEENNNPLRYLLIDKGAESSTFLEPDKKYELSANYTTYYNLMFKGNIDIKNALMLGGAGYSYPKYYISHYLDKNMDVVEIDEKVTELAKSYFFLDDLYNDYELNNTNRLNIITADGRSYLNQNTKKYDAILNDAFAGYSPATTLTTKEAAELIHSSLNTNGLYLSNIISSIDGENSRFLKSEVATLYTVFKNVYVIPCNQTDDLTLHQNIMVIATDDNLSFDGVVSLNSNNNPIILTDNYCPVDSLIPII